VLRLSEDWRTEGSFPAIILAGKILFLSDCYSTGQPEQCIIGHGMTRSRGAICLGLPFVDREWAACFRGEAVFQTDNTQEAFQSIMKLLRARVTRAQSSLNAYANTIFPDARPSTRQRRERFTELFSPP
jgi:hypothetical protein